VPDLCSTFLLLWWAEGDAEVKTNHVFIKLLGERKGEAMDYRDVDNISFT